MLVRNDGTQIGLLSAGCLEEDLALRVEETRKQRTTQTVVYDMRDENDLLWGLEAGCNGVINVLLEPVDACLRAHLCQLKFHLESGRRVTVLKKFTKEQTVSDYLFITDEDDFFGKWHGAVPLEVKSLLSGMHKTYSKSGMKFIPELAVNIYIHSFEPKPRLIVFGAGRDAVPLVKLASQAGFSILVSDWRPALCQEEFFPDAKQLLVGFPSEVILQLQLSRYDSVLILTHHFQRDKEILNQLKGEKLNYLGVLGSKSRTQRLLDGNPIPPEISSPVGLAIGAEGPEEIAISIVAELILWQRSTRVEKVINF